MFFILFFKIELGIWRVKNKPLHWDRKPGNQGFQGKCWEESEVGTGLRVIQKGTGWGEEQQGVWGLHCMSWRATHALPVFPGQVLASFSALSTALEACTLKGARNKACECDLGLQSPSPTTTMEGKGAEGMLVSRGTRQQRRGGGHGHHLSLLGPAVSCWPRQGGLGGSVGPRVWHCQDS